MCILTNMCIFKYDTLYDILLLYIFFVSIVLLMKVNKNFLSNKLSFLS